MRALEDLRTQVRSPRSRKYVDEAIAAYGAGAYRSSIIAIWIAVVSDLIDKIRLLADDGEAAAITMRQVLDNAISNADKTAMQKFEFSVLEAAKSSLHIIGEQECVDLERLRHDRHLCAHPAYMSDDELFDPSAERVRAHLANAVDALLAHGPVVGRKAIERFRRDIESKSFPVSSQNLRTYLAEVYLERGTSTFVTNFFRVICKALLDRESTGELRARYVRTAQALYELRPVELESTLARVVESRIGTFNDDASLFVLISGLCRVSCGWNQLNEGIRARVVLLLKNASVKELVRDHELFGPLPKPPIDDVVLERLQEVLLSDTYSADFIEQVEVEPDVRILEAVKSYVRDASDYFLAQAALRGAISMIPIMTPADLAVILERAAKNDQVTGSVLANRQLSVLRRQTTALGEDFAAEWDKYDAMLVE